MLVTLAFTSSHFSPGVRQKLDFLFSLLLAVILIELPMYLWGPLGRPNCQVPQLPYLMTDPAVKVRFGCHSIFLNGSYGYFGRESNTEQAAQSRYPDSRSSRNGLGSLVRNCQEGVLVSQLYSNMHPRL